MRFALVLTAVIAAAGCSGVSPLAPDVEYENGPGDGPIRYVVHVSVDGLRPDAVTRQLSALPAFARLREQAAFTDNARTDPDYSNTLPNHTAQLTGRGVTGPAGHAWDTNRDPDPTVTLHSNRGRYIASVFDVAHDHGLRTGLYASKSKFALYDRSYGASHGAPDATGPNDGRDKIDTFVYDSDTGDLVRQLVADLRAEPYGYVFVHLRDPDSAGHAFGWRLWSWHPYMRAVRRADARIGEILAAIDSDPELSGHTALVVTADHGGTGHHHGAGEREHYTVPFYLWAPGVEPGDLYALYPNAFADPSDLRPGFGGDLQPVRNGAAGNVSLALLGLPPIPGSTISMAGTLLVAPDDAPTTAAQPVTPER
ncbi:MAG TPA: hypothetical protein EYQ24_17605 [Bacteroidetes bacterium]|nr:hypothetical protein [Bacteroidota bacterium]